MVDSSHELRDLRALEGYPNHPAVFVTWFEALARCRWLGGKLKEEAAERFTREGPGAEPRELWEGLTSGRFVVTPAVRGGVGEVRARG